MNLLEPVRVFPFLSSPRGGSVVLIVTLHGGAQCSKKDIVSTLQLLHGDLRVGDIKPCVGGEQGEPSRQQGREPFAAAFEIKLRGAQRPRRIGAASPFCSSAGGT